VYSGEVWRIFENDEIIITGPADAISFKPVVRATTRQQFIELKLFY